MGWIEDHLRRSPQSSSSANPFTEQAQRRWSQLGQELQADVDEFNAHQQGAAFSQPTTNQFLVTNAVSGLQLVITADFDGHIIRYVYSAINDSSAGIPEGGMLSMRQSRHGDVEFYSADERLTSEETREILLEPVLFPPQIAA